jgi:hypothetical protein
VVAVLELHPQSGDRPELIVSILILTRALQLDGDLFVDEP